jgi:hypothetical protein
MEISWHPVFDSLDSDHMNRDFVWFYDHGYSSLFKGRYPQEFLVARSDLAPGWHLVGGKDILRTKISTGKERRMGIRWCSPIGSFATAQVLKVKLTAPIGMGLRRIVEVGRIAIAHDVDC